MKQIKKILSIFLLIASLITIAACNETTGESYTVTFDTVGGSPVASQTVAAGKTARKPNNPTKEGYTFENWLLNGDLYDFTSVVNSDITLTAQWTIGEVYTVTFYSDGAVYQSYTLRENETISKPADPTKSGYTFRGWYKDEALTTPYVLPNTMKNTDLSLYAGWRKATQNTITFVTNCAASLNPLKKYEGESLNLSSLNISNPGYELEGWYLDAELTNKFTATTMPGEDFTLYAKWISSSNVNTINVNYGDVVKQIYVEKTVSTVDSITFDLANYVLEEWQDASGNALSFPLQVTDGMTVYAKYYSDGLVVRHNILTAYTGLSTEVIVPSSLNGVEILTIGNGESPFTSSSVSSQITKIIIPEGVTRLENNAFFGLTGLKELVLPATLESIGTGVFYECTSLEALNLSGNVNFPYEDGILYNADKTAIIKFIGSVETLNIASTIKEIAAHAFAYADIKKLVVGENVEKIGAYAFANCKVEELTYAPSVNNVADYAFRDCTALTKVIFGENITTIGTFAFSRCISLSEVIPSANQTEKISVDSFAFEKCTSLKTFDYEKFSLIDGTVFSFAGIESYTLDSDITVIPANMFVNWVNLKAITIPASVTEIGESAFYGCTSLANVTFEAGSKLEIIKTKAFAVTAVETFDFAANCQNLKEVHASAFAGCENTKTLTFPKSMEYFELGALAGCSYLENLTIPFVGAYSYTRLLNDFQAQIDAGQELNIIGQEIYEYCLAGEDSYIDLVTGRCLGSDFLFGYIFGRETYENATQVGQIFGSDGSTAIYYLPTNLNNITVTGKFIPAYGFSTISTITKSPAVTENMRIIGTHAVYYCENLEDVTLVEGVEEIRDSAFALNLKLNSVTLPDSVIFIGYDAFYNARELTEIRLPYNDNLFVDVRAFNECDNISSVYQLETDKAEDTITLVKGAFASYVFPSNNTIRFANLGKDVTLHCVDATALTLEPSNAVFGSMIALEVINLPSQLKSIYHGELINEIPANFFQGLNSLRQVNTEGKSISDYYEEGATLPESYVLLPDGITTIGYQSFYLTASASKIDIVILPESVTTVKSYAFMYSGIKEIDMRYVTELVGYDGVSITYTPTSIFSNCADLEKVIISGSITSIPQYMFRYATNLRTLGYYDAETGELHCNDGEFLLSPNVTELKNRCFNQLEELKEIILPEALKIIEGGVFYKCSNLTSITIPENVELIDTMAFQECNLKEVTFEGNNVSVLGDQVFAYNVELVELIFPEGIIEIGNRPFAGCTSIEKVTVPSTCVEFASSYGFQDCPNLKTLVILSVTPPNVDGGVMDMPTLFYNSITGQRYSGAELLARGFKIYVPTQSLELYKYHNGTYQVYSSATPNPDVRTRNLTGWRIYYADGLIEGIEYGYYSNGVSSVQLDQDHNGAYLTTSGDLPAANKVKVTLDENGKVVYENYTFTFTTVEGYSSVTINNGTATTTMTNVTAHYIDPSDSQIYAYIDADEDGIANKNVGFKDEVAEGSDYKVLLPIQFRNYLTLGTNGVATFTVHRVGTANANSVDVFKDYAMDLPSYKAIRYDGTYKVNSDGTITVTINYTVVENYEEVVKTFEIVVSNGQTNTFIAHDNNSYQFSRLDLFDGPMQ